MNERGEFRIKSSAVGPISEGSEATSTTGLDLDELLVCFPTDVYILGGDDAICLKNAPVLGFLTDLCYLWQEAKQGKRLATIADFYDDYCLVLRVTDGSVGLGDKYAQSEVNVKIEKFCRVCASWVQSLLSEFKSVYPDVVENDDYREIEKQALSVWAQYE